MTTGAEEGSVKLDETAVATPQEPRPSPAQQHTNKPSFIRRRWEWIRGWLYWFFPNWRAVNKADPLYEKSHDAKENEQMRVPADAELRVPMVWGCELYGPAEINDLYAGLQTLEWGSFAQVGDRGGIEKWIKEHRADGREGASFNGGFVERQGSSTPYCITENVAPLPDEVKWMDVQVFQLSPSLTALLLGFRLNEAVARRYDEEINRDRTTYRKRVPGGKWVSVIRPESQKAATLASVRSDLRRMVAGWYKDHLPGYFSSLDREKAFPMMELLSVKKGPVFQQPDETARGVRWRWLLSAVFAPEVWTCQKHRGLQLVFSDVRAEDRGCFITAAMDQSLFPEASLKQFGKAPFESMISICSEALLYVLPHAATMEYVKEQTRYLNLSRERLKKARAGRGKLGHTLETINQFFDRTLGVPALARELARKSERPAEYLYEIGVFTAPPWGAERDPEKLSDNLQARTHNIASRLAEEEVVMRGHFEQLSTILSVYENVKAQRRMQTLTVVTLFVALVSLAVAFAAFVVTPHAVEEVKHLWATRTLSP